MKRATVVCVLIFFLAGCATYKFHRGQSPYDKGYVASRDSYTIPEYTLGKDNSVPRELALAKERFRKRRGKVEYYYKKMGVIENRFKRTAYDPAAMFVKLVTGIFRLPFIAVSDYKYDHNPVYREKVRKMEEERDLKEEARVASLKQQLNLYIQKALDSEKPAVAGRSAQLEAAHVSKAESVETELTHLEKMSEQTAASEAGLSGSQVSEVGRELNAAKEEQKITPPARKPREAKPRPEKKKPPVVKAEPVAVIKARPQRGFSPLTVRFSGNGSRSPAGKIVSYYWDFGDGDTSTMPNPRNTYYSGLSEPQAFTVTLTVKDAQGNTASSKIEIEVLNK